MTARNDIGETGPQDRLTAYEAERALREAEHRKVLSQRRRARWQALRRVVVPWA
ncbi:hypothetical protein ACOXXX_12895 [Thalassococcus sp. BH17M4-6]|uniref:hypothetical protein n=1 Tax=Thalassococcus sp. BH17M4-6 TaxID=3413148 RepID=UPI003BE10978